MNITRTNMVSFGAFMIERGKKTPAQVEKMRKIAMAPEITQTLVERLEKTGTDIYLSASKDKESVNLKLKTAAGLRYSFIPSDDMGFITCKINNPDLEEDKIVNFVIRSSVFNLEKKYSGQNAIRVKILEDLTEKDLYSKVPHQVSHTNLLPDADCYFGTQQVTTKDFLRD